MIITKVNNKIKQAQVNQLTKIIKSENSNAIISFLSAKNLNLFLEKTILSKKLDLFIVKKITKL